MATIIKIDGDHWTVDGEDIRYSNDFGHTGWYWDKDGPYLFPPTRNNFLEALEEAMKEDITGPEVQARPAG